MLPAIFVEVEAVLVFRLFRRILYLDNKEDVRRWRENGGYAGAARGI